MDSVYAFGLIFALWAMMLVVGGGVAYLAAAAYRKHKDAMLAESFLQAEAADKIEYAFVEHSIPVFPGCGVVPELSHKYRVYAAAQGVKVFPDYWDQFEQTGCQVGTVWEEDGNTYKWGVHPYGDQLVKMNVTRQHTGPDTLAMPDARTLEDMTRIMSNAQVGEVLEDPVVCAEIVALRCKEAVAEAEATKVEKPKRKPRKKAVKKPAPKRKKK